MQTLISTAAAGGFCNGMSIESDVAHTLMARDFKDPPFVILEVDDGRDTDECRL